MGYLALYPTAEEGAIGNVLTNNTFDAIAQELIKEGYKWNEGLVPEERQIEIISDNVFDFETFKDYVSQLIGIIQTEKGKEAFNSFVEIPEEERVIEVIQKRDKLAIESIYKRIEDCRAYMAKKWNI